MMDQQTLPENQLPAAREEEEKLASSSSEEEPESCHSAAQEEDHQKDQLPEESASTSSPESESMPLETPLHTQLKPALRQQQQPSPPPPIFIAHERSTCQHPTNPPNEQPKHSHNHPHVQFDSITIHYHGIALGDSPSTHKGPPIALANELICSEKYPTLEQYEHERLSHRHKKRATRTSARFRQQVLLRAGVTHSQIQERIEELADYHHNMENFGAVSSAALPHYHFGRDVTKYSYEKAGSSNADCGSSAMLCWSRIDELEKGCYDVVAPQESDVVDYDDRPTTGEAEDTGIRAGSPPPPHLTSEKYLSQPNTIQNKRTSMPHTVAENEHHTQSFFDCLSIC